MHRLNKRLSKYLLIFHCVLLIVALLPAQVMPPRVMNAGIKMNCAKQWTIDLNKTVALVVSGNKHHDRQYY